MDEEQLIYFDEAFKQLKKNWFPNDDPCYNDNYITLTRTSIQSIIKKDIVGRYLGLKDGERKKKKYTDLNNESKIEDLYVFPKYNFRNEEPLILSVWDEHFNNKKLMSLHEKYIKSGRPNYLMNNAYVFSLKHELERRQYPLKSIYISIDSKAQIRNSISDDDAKSHFTELISETLNNFNMRIQEHVSIHNNTKKVECDRLNSIIFYINNKLKILDKNIQLKNSFLTEKENINELMDMLKKDFSFNFNTEEKIQNTIEKYSKCNCRIDQEKEYISRELYDFETNIIKKYYVLIQEDNTLRKKAFFERKKSETALLRAISAIQNSEERKYYLSGLEIIGIR
ncbi:hypothetical protein [Acetobacterium tundrae]|uniref:Uncharacterized protein n=1 Tax=Acetobacterium tundrae TaxID=132932 RepID=A0ABR6WIT8_9FIRM|nr:hypothetical protein [Acetobacterium tundrae]MBC3796415.1 hypothetical protein [Acetobacterium tundrae]